MKNILFLLIAGLLLIGVNGFAQNDVSIDSDGNVTTGAANPNANLEVTGASGEDAIRGYASGTGGEGVRGENTMSGDYGILGYTNGVDYYGVYGYSPSGYAGYFMGNARITGNLMLDGSLLGPVLGDITGVTAGTGLTGGGTSGNVTLSADTTVLQSRVSDSCPAGQSIRVISSTGTVTCEVDDTGTDTDWTISGTNIFSGVSGNVGIGTTNPYFKLDVWDHTPGYVANFRNENNSSGEPASGISVFAEASDTGSGVGTGGTFYGLGGSTGGAAYGTQIYAIANGSSEAYGVYSDATPGSTAGREWAFYGIGDGYFSGDVGIGTTSPDGALEVARDQVTPVIMLTGYKSGSGSPVLFMGRRARGTMGSAGPVLTDDVLASFAGTGYGTSGFAQSRGRMDVIAAEDWTDAAQGTNITFRTTNINTTDLSEKMRITDDGRVGIGDDDPYYKLEVREARSNYVAGFINDNNSYHANAYGILSVGDARDAEYADGVGGSFTGYGGSTGGDSSGIRVGTYSYGNSEAYGVYSDATLGSTSGREYAFYGYGDGYFSGDVGIGTDSPAYPLDIAGHARVQGPDGFDSAGETAIIYYGDGNHSIKGTYAGGLNVNSYDGATDPITFSFSGSEKMRITNTGSIGIGTTTPAGKLDVNGAIYQRGGLLHADYVFEPSYSLESIEEHAEYMWSNKHLKAIPKARVDEQGQEIVEVGSHRKGIVEELEKAHIYIDQLHKQNKALEERLAKLEALLDK